VKKLRLERWQPQRKVLDLRLYELILEYMAEMMLVQVGGPDRRIPGVRTLL
jgi:hypothetical protein